MLVVAVEGIDGSEVGVTCLFLVQSGVEQAEEGAKSESSSGGKEKSAGLQPPGEKARGPGEVFLVGGDAMPDLALEIAGSGSLHLPGREEFVERIFGRVHGRWRVGFLWGDGS